MLFSCVMGLFGNRKPTSELSVSPHESRRVDHVHETLYVSGSVSQRPCHGPCTVASRTQRPQPHDTLTDSQARPRTPPAPRHACAHVFTAQSNGSRTVQRCGGKSLGAKPSALGARGHGLAHGVYAHRVDSSRRASHGGGSIGAKPSLHGLSALPPKPMCIVAKLTASHGACSSPAGRVSATYTRRVKVRVRVEAGLEPGSG